MRFLYAALIAAVAPCLGFTQPTVAALDVQVPALSVNEKLSLHWNNASNPLTLAGLVGYAGLLQAVNSPREWGQGWEAYGERLGSTAAGAAIHSGLAFGLDSTLHQDPRYFPARKGNLLRRAGHALRGTILTRTDSGSETFSTWRVGSAYGAAFLSNLWYPKRLDTFGLGCGQGSIALGFDFVKNLSTEFWPDVKRKFARSKPAPVGHVKEVMGDTN